MGTGMLSPGIICIPALQVRRPTARTPARRLTAGSWGVTSKADICWVHVTLRTRQRRAVWPHRRRRSPVAAPRFRSAWLVHGGRVKSIPATALAHGTFRFNLPGGLAVVNYYVLSKVRECLVHDSAGTSTQNQTLALYADSLETAEVSHATREAREKVKGRRRLSARLRRLAP